MGEPDVEVQELLQRSAGRNLGLDYLPGALDFEAGADGVDPVLAGRVLWFDALIGNVDRSWRNPNMLFWHGRLQLIDHGAALTFHHHWPGAAAAVEPSVRRVRARADRVRADVPAADADLAPRVTRQLLDDVLALVPDAWLEDDEPLCACVRGTSTSCWPGWPPATPGCPVWSPRPRPAVAGAAGRRAGRTARLARAAAARGSDATMRDTFEYAVLRVVPRVERGEALNAGVLVYCRQRDYLGSRVHLDVDRLHALDPTADAEAIGRALQAAADICAAEPGRARPGGRRSGRGSAG